MGTSVSRDQNKCTHQQRFQSSTFIPNGTWVDIIIPQLPTTGVSFTACYTSWDLTDFDVNLSGGTFRPEPAVGYSPMWAFNHYNQSEVIKQLDFSHSPGERGILVMQKKNSWIPAAADMPPPGYYLYLLAFIEMSGQI